MMTKKQRQQYKERYLKRLNRGEIKLVCPICNNIVIKETIRQRMCKKCSKMRRKKNYKEHSEAMVKKRKGKTNIEIYGAKRAAEIKKIKIKGFRSKSIICCDCGKKEQRTATRQKYCKSCSRRRDNLSKRNWAKKNILKCREYKWRRMEKEKNVIHDFSTKEWLQKLKNTFGVCPHCDRFVGIENLSLDHIYPISKAKNGQIYTINDVQPLCKSCNSKKGDKI